ncbi:MULTISPECIES: hypothetical protein [Salinibaculum]|uniref:hypothetical protein n=1 Tax=Salinibaculum TaxID=2732368 RepID=UPI0030CC4135
MVDRSYGSHRAVTLASLILLAGCTGLVATNQQTPTPEPTVENFSYPSGWSQAGITDLTVALGTNDETVENVSRKSRLVIADEDSNRTIVRVLDTEAGTGSVQLIDTQLDADIHRYYTAEGVFEYDRMTEKLSRMPDENWTAADVATVDDLKQPLRDLELNATEAVTVEGTTAVTYTVTGIRNPESVPADTATGHVTIAEEGFIAEFNITRGNDEFTRQTMYDLSAFGNATVTRPAWMPDE